VVQAGQPLQKTLSIFDHPIIVKISSISMDADCPQKSVNCYPVSLPILAGLCSDKTATIFLSQLTSERCKNSVHNKLKMHKCYQNIQYINM
jgi:hypothetical protein